ncbi:hypothetical protein QPK87_28025 [Kamptonema cortianum]|nr:hypothetical protein [Kamptonema cortianum]
MINITAAGRGIFAFCNTCTTGSSSTAISHANTNGRSIVFTDQKNQRVTATTATQSKIRQLANFGFS